MTTLIASLALSLALTASPQPPAGAAQPSDSGSSALQQLSHSLGADKNGHRHGHGEEPPPSPEELARQNEMNALSEQKLQALAAYLQALVDGKSDAEAVRQAGVPITDLDKIAFLSERYYPARAQALQMEADLRSMRAMPAASPADERDRRSKEQALARKLAAHERFRGQFFKNVSEASRTLIDKYEPTFVQLIRRQQEKRDSLRQEARQLAVKNFSGKCIPGFIAYLNALGAGRSEHAAIQASGLDEKMVLGLSQLVSEYSSHKLNAQKAAEAIPEVQTRLEEKKKAGQSTAFEARLIQYHQEQVAAFEAFRKQFAADNGEALSQAIDSHFGELMAGYAKHQKLKANE